MFQGHPQTLPISFPFRGINVNSQNDTQYARFTQNILVGDNKAGNLRYGTALISSFLFDQNRIFQDIISVMSFLKQDGSSEKLVYVQYLVKTEDWIPIPTITNIENLQGYCKFSINLTNLTADQKIAFRKMFFNGIYIYFQQTGISDGAEIENFVEQNNIVTFQLPFNQTFFEPNFSIFIERAGIYRVKDNNSYELVKDNLDPAVIISHINFQGKLLIANGIDPVQVYDGTSAVDLQALISVPTINSITSSINGLAFTIPLAARDEMQAKLKIGTILSLINPNETRNVTITSITFTPNPSNPNLINVNIFTNVAPGNDIRKILYKKTCPSFSFLAIVHKRLWALPEGRVSQSKFRSPLFAMKAYYSANIETIDDWFNQKTNEIDFIDLSSTSAIPDNLEAISTFEGKTLFLGRETTQVWAGEDPTTLDDGKNIELPDFKWEQTLPVGVLQQNLYLEIPNNFIFLSKYGIVSISSINVAQQIQVSFQFSTPVDNYVSTQLSFIETDRDYRAMKAFLYPYGRFMGFRIKYSCFIYQLNLEGAWTVFTENFAESTSMLYDSTNKNLYLGLPKGILLVYTDKIKQKSYNEYSKGQLSWVVAYNWTYFASTWNNTNVYVDAKTLFPTTINVRIYINQDETQSINEEIIIEKEGMLYDNFTFGIRPYPFNETKFSYEIVKFTADSVMIELSGLSNDVFCLNTIFLAGGNTNSN